MNFRWLVSARTSVDSFLQEKSVIELTLTANDKVMRGKVKHELRVQIQELED